MKNPTTLVTKSPLARAVDFAHLSNVLVVVVSSLVAVAFGIYNLFDGEPLPTPWWAAGGGVFVAWAIAREIDPDHNMAAAVAMVPVVVFSALARPSLLAGAGLLLAVRLSSGTVGLPRRAIDTTLLVALGVMLGFSGGAIVVVPALIVAVAIHDSTSRSSVVVGAAIGGVALISYLAGGTRLDFGPPGPAALASVLLIGAALAVTLPVDRVSSRTDSGDIRLVGWRVGVSRTIAGTTAMFAVVAGGQVDGLATAATIVSSMMGVAVVRILAWQGATIVSRMESWLSND